jgi:putative cardiolipin synthase
LFVSIDLLRMSAIRLVQKCSQVLPRTAKAFSCAFVVSSLWFSAAPASEAFDPVRFIDQQVQTHPGLSGSYVLEKGEESLLARAWLADHARRTIDVQYFIWSSDNVGILASEALLRAAERGVHVRVLVDDLLMDVPDKALLALEKHPNFDIRIYNPMHSVGTRLPKRLLNIATDFRGANQRMHNKTFIVDAELAITGGRNMADEYFDFDHEYNFRDRDALVLGEVAHAMRKSFDEYWNDVRAVPVEELYDGFGLMQKSVHVDDVEVREVYAQLHAYAQSAENFEPAIHAAIDRLPRKFPELASQLVWGNVEFIVDKPGKNSGDAGLGGGGLTTQKLAALLNSAKQEVLIQSPYLVLSDDALALFKKVLARGVRIRIHTNSLASTDNLQAFAGYRNQREELLSLGIGIFEFKPDSLIQRQIMERYAQSQAEAPIFALHAKTMVIDRKAVFIGTYNLDPRSENLNTEVGVLIRNERQANEVANAIEADMLPANSWNARGDNPDQFTSWWKRMKVSFWQWMPMKPLL